MYNGNEVNNSVVYSGTVIITLNKSIHTTVMCHELGVKSPPSVLGSDATWLLSLGQRTTFCHVYIFGKKLSQHSGMEFKF